MLEDLDALAGTVSVKHYSDDDIIIKPLLLAAASVDKMVLKKPISINLDLEISNAVIWVGRSSIEVQLEATRSPNESPNASDSVALTASFIFVAREYRTKKTAPANRLPPETEQEKLLFEEAEVRNNLRKRESEERG